MARSIKVVPPKYGERTVYYAIEKPLFAPTLVGPANSIGELEKMLQLPGEYMLVTKVKTVVVE